MKYSCLIIQLFIFGSISVSGQILNPLFDRRDVSECDIIRIERENTNTTVYFNYTNTVEGMGTWVCAGRFFFIRDTDTKIKYKLIKANNIPICPEKHYFEYSGQKLEFNLIFETLPASTIEIDIIEDGENRGFNFFGVKLSRSGHQVEGSNLNNKINNSPMRGHLKEWEKYFDDNITTIDNIEGIYKCNWYSIKYYGGEFIGRVRDKESEKEITNMVIKKNNKGGYTRYYFYSTFSLPWDELIKTYSEDKYILHRDSPHNSYLDNSEVNYHNKTFIINYTLDYDAVLDEYVKSQKTKRTRLDYNILEVMARQTRRISEQNMIKIYPTREIIEIKERKAEVENTSFFGTGFAISTSGMIVTNYHVVENSKTIKIKGINSDFHKSYNAEVLLTDKNNDLAILQIKDERFTTLQTIPYTIKTNLSMAGEGVFVLGYPLRATMGDEIKITDGIISSRTGFQGDITAYQISAPIQSGNSGGPLFDSSGNLIGIVNAKHTKAENATYAIKAGYLSQLIELLEYSPNAHAVNTLSGKSLADQVEIIRQFVYIIEVN